MARCIDADAMNVDIDLSKGASVLDLALSVLKAVKEAPVADVVPKSEVERIEQAYNDRLTKDIETNADFVKHAKAEVAREIFEEIDRIIDEKYNRFVFKDQPYDSDEEIDAIINYSDSVSDAITGLKKKYEGGEFEGEQNS